MLGAWWNAGGRPTCAGRVACTSTCLKFTRGCCRCRRIARDELASIRSDSSVDSLVGRIRLEPASRAPLHAQLTDALRRLIREGHLGQGAELPGELELATMVGVSRHTVRHALGTLVSEGWLGCQRGPRTVVASGPARTR